MAKKTSLKKKVSKKAPVDKTKTEKLSLKDSVQYVKIYPKYNPLRE
ncbi:hypothetical protein N9P25_01910 [Flavobacteriaceae bacterium]|jgi:hypothetical protein|nr:hypothetical protein [Flavobacteriaceae bacterium]|tara:strand:- start:818 stop:955 length:138 start_codon:yes stop_codon:yes gene_type:complete